MPHAPDQRAADDLLAVLHQLDEDAGGGFRMYESNEPAVRALAGYLVDELGALSGKRLEGRREVVNAVGDVMKALPAFREKAADRRFRRERLQQLDPRGSAPDEYHVHTLRLDPLARGGPAAGHFLEKWLCESD